MFIRPLFLLSLSTSYVNTQLKTWLTNMPPYTPKEDWILDVKVPFHKTALEKVPHTLLVKTLSLETGTYRINLNQNLSRPRFLLVPRQL